MEGRRLSLAWRCGKKFFCIRGKVLAAVRRVEAFREDDERGASFRSFKDFGASTGEIDSLVGAWIALAVASS